MMNFYGYPPGYHPASPASATPPGNGHIARARLDGGQWISQDGETIYHFRYGGYWRARWTGDGFGAWELSPDAPEGAVKL